MLESQGGKLKPQELQDSGFLEIENGGEKSGGLKAGEIRRLGWIR